MKIKFGISSCPNDTFMFEALINSKIDLVINTTFSSKEIIESFSIRRTSLVKQIPYFGKSQSNF